jgi:ABC-type multidrug transport system ATPase subunit
MISKKLAKIKDGVIVEQDSPEYLKNKKKKMGVSAEEDEHNSDELSFSDLEERDGEEEEGWNGKKMILSDNINNQLFK